MFGPGLLTLAMGLGVRPSANDMLTEWRDGLLRVMLGMMGAGCSTSNTGSGSSGAVEVACSVTSPMSFTAAFSYTLTIFMSKFIYLYLVLL